MGDGFTTGRSIDDCTVIDVLGRFGDLDEPQQGAVRIYEGTDAKPRLLEAGWMESREPRGGLREPRVETRAVDGVDVVEAQTAPEGALGGVEVGEGEELEHHLATTEDHPALVAVHLRKAEATVEGGRRAKVARGEMGGRGVGHPPTLGVLLDFGTARRTVSSAGSRAQ